MTQRELILQALIDETMSQAEIAKRIDRQSSAIYTALQKLVVDGLVEKNDGNRGAVYSLRESRVSLNNNLEQEKCFVGFTQIDNQKIEDVEKVVMNTSNYGVECQLVNDCFSALSKNTDINTVALKIGLIDVTNSTNISRYKRFISVYELAEIITKIPDIDNRIKDGDPDVVREIALNNGNIKLLSFASKYCCYQNVAYGKDDYSIFDKVLHDCLPIYFSELSKKEIDKWYKECNYKAYNDFITKQLDALHITITNRKRKFDHFVWYTNR